jgi:uncharacterized protein (TIGR03118 family)
MLAAALLAVPLALTVLTAPNAGAAPPTGAAQAAAAPAAAPMFTETDLVSDVPGRAALTDPDVVNAWGLALSPTSPLWVANNGTNTATLYAGGANGSAATKVPLTVAIPGGAPTGQVFNDTASFVVTSPAGSGPARFMFVSEDGEVAGWNPAAAPTTAIVAAHSVGAVYKGLALLHTDAGPYLLAADFRHGRIDVYDGQFQRVRLPGSLFTDRTLPQGYAPFDVAVLGGGIYVTYAKQGQGKVDEVDGPGLGFVDRYNAFGLLSGRVASRGTLNAPWGLAIAPASFGSLAGDLLVGNFGDGRISVFDTSGGFAGQLQDAAGNPLAIEGLWALLPGTANTGGTDAVWFSAGPGEEEHGLVGLIRPAS